MKPVQQEVRTADGRDLITYTWGGGQQLVVLEAGLGMSGRSWAPIAHRLAQHCTVVAYDRAGYGTSTPDPAPRTLDRLAGDLCHVVKAQGTNPVLLVGHSLGGPIVRRAAELLPADQVDGIVLVDPADERANVYFTRAARVMERVQALALPVLSKTGALRAGLLRSCQGLAEDDLHAVADACSSPSAARASSQEHQHLRDGLQQLKDASSPRPIPTTLISGTRPSRLGGARQQLLAAHRESVASNRSWRLVEATASTHLVMLTQPELVAEEILQACNSDDTDHH